MSEYVVGILPVIDGGQQLNHKFALVVTIHFAFG